jgi:hypothetical protein
VAGPFLALKETDTVGRRRGLIDRKGRLSIKPSYRKDFRPALCHMGGQRVQCSESCPLFGERRVDETDGTHHLELCHREIQFYRIRVER